MKRSGKIALIVFALMVIVALVAPLLVGDFGVRLEKRFESPSFSHPFGLDHNGIDVFDQVLYGSRTSLFVAISVVCVSVSIGLVVGTVLGWRGGWVDLVFSRFIDMLQAFPGFLLALSIVAMLGTSMSNLILALCITGWAGYARLVRAEVQRLKTLDYVVAAHSTGASALRICARHIWPNLWNVLLVQASFGLAGLILVESSLSYLGLGVPSETPSWGAILNNGRRFLYEAPHVSFFPGLAILILVASVQTTGESLRAYFNPRERD